MDVGEMSYDELNNDDLSKLYSVWCIFLLVSVSILFLSTMSPEIWTIPLNICILINLAILTLFFLRGLFHRDKELNNQ